MTVEQKREIANRLDWLEENVENRIEMMGIKFTLHVLGYWACPTKDGYKIRKK